MGSSDLHWILYTCPATKTSPALGAIKVAEYFCPLSLGLAVAVPINCGTKTTVNAKNSAMNRGAFILLLDSHPTAVSRVVF